VRPFQSVRLKYPATSSGTIRKRSKIKKAGATKTMPAKLSCLFALACVLTVSLRTGRVREVVSAIIKIPCLSLSKDAVIPQTLVIMNAKAIQ
jgi:hypothetical protein